MKFTEKLRYLRTNKHLSREQLAELCDVSPQAVAKWENGTAFPKPEKLLLLTEIFEIPADILLKESLSIGEIKSSDCSFNCVVTKNVSVMYEGILIKESINDECIIDMLNVHKIELWKTNSHPKYWTALTFTSNEPSLPEALSNAIIDTTSCEGTWFADFKSGNTKYIVFHDLVLHYETGNIQEKLKVCDKCREMGIPDCQMNWSE